ncbi:MAG: ATP-dependent sacrificial sulfur transferase LarE [Candidatus Aquicultorales bacterium]
MHSSEKFEQITKIIARLDSVVVAFSGGVDSALVAWAAVESGVGCAAVTAVSATLPQRELKAARRIAGSIGIRHFELAVDELASDDFAANPRDRCYHCKILRTKEIKDWAREHGFRAVADGANADDPGDWRPGLEAGRELGVFSPLMDAGIRKDDVRTILRESGFRFWDKPSSPCLASRLPYGTPVTAERLAQVEKAEDLILALGVSDVRVRHFGETARIDVPQEDFPLLLSAPGLAEAVKALGFTYVTLHLDGLQSGSLNQ